jgi:hypothetical protein
MNPINRLTTSAAILLALTTAPLMAADTSPSGRGPIPFESFDGNGDGYVSQEEYGQARANRMQQRAEQGGQFRNQGNAPGFEDIDSNSDGRLSREEVQAHHQKRYEMRYENRQRMPGPQGGGMGPGGGMGGGNRQ